MFSTKHMLKFHQLSLMDILLAKCGHLLPGVIVTAYQNIQYQKPKDQNLNLCCLKESLISCIIKLLTSADKCYETD
jgi:hypothetical protein